MTDPVSIATTAFTILLLGLCAYLDVKHRRIPNWATLPGIALGLGMNSLQGWSGLKVSGIGLLVGFGALLVLFVLGWMGGGDVKLMAAVGALKGSPFVVSALFYSLLMGVAIGVVMLIWNRRTLQTFRNLLFIIGSRVSPRIPRQNIEPAQAQKVPFGLAIVLGTVLAMIVGYAWNPLRLTGL